MSTFSGLFDLQTPSDLLKKLEYDFERLSNNPLDQYAAFDFFITAHHIAEWLPSDKGIKHTELRQSEPLLKICSHIANGSKHFKVNPNRHNSVKNAEYHHGAFSSAFSDGFDISRLEIHLEEPLKDEKGVSLGDKIEVRILAKMILDYWQKYLHIS